MFLFLGWSEMKKSQLNYEKYGKINVNKSDRAAVSKKVISPQSSKNTKKPPMKTRTGLKRKVNRHNLILTY